MALMRSRKVFEIRVLTRPMRISIAEPGVRADLRIHARLSVVVADGRRSDGAPLAAAEKGPAVLLFPGFDAPMTAFEVARTRLIASAREAVVVTVQVPGGPGPSHAPLGAAQRRALVRGDFRPVAAEMLSAMCTYLPPGGAVELWGYSMGASIAAAGALLMARAGTPPCRVTLVEPVGAARWGPLRLLGAERREASATLNHLASTATLGWFPPPEDADGRAQRRRVRRIDLAAQGWAISRARILSDLLATARQAGPLPVDIVSGARSVLAPARTMAAARRVLDQGGCEGSWTEVPGATHALWHDAHVILDLLQQGRTTDEPSLPVTPQPDAKR